MDGELGEVLKRIKGHANVRGIVVTTTKSQTIYSTISPDETKEATKVAVELCRSVRDHLQRIDKVRIGVLRNVYQSEPRMIRVRTSEHSYLVYREGEYIIMCSEEISPVVPVNNA